MIATERTREAAEIAGRRQLVTPADLVVVHSDEVERRTRAAADSLHPPIVPLDAPDAYELTRWEPLQLVADGHLARDDRSGHDRPVPGDGERAVDRHPERPRVGAARGRVAEPLETFLERRDPALASARGRSPDHLGVVEERPRHQGADLFLDEVEPGRVDQVALGQGDHPPGQSQQAEDVEVLAGLRHDRVVGRDDQHRQVEPRGPREHVPDESLVTRDVHQGQVVPAQFHRGEAEVDRDSPLPFLGQTVGVDPGQGAHQGRLPMIDVARRAQDEVSLIRHGVGIPLKDSTRPRGKSIAKVRHIVEYTGSGRHRRGEIRARGWFLPERVIGMSGPKKAADRLRELCRLCGQALLAGDRADLARHCRRGRETPTSWSGPRRPTMRGSIASRDGLALVQTVDFFPPLVDDPFQFGQIAAANALSDVYAMNGRPLTVLNIVGFPDEELPLSVLAEILRGAADRVDAAGAVTVGGHSLRDSEIKFGLSVTGLVEPSAVLTNAGARAGDALVLTKPLGTGFITTANKKGDCPVDVLNRAIDSMIQLNAVGRDACSAAGGVHAATDVTGFGLAGHAAEMAEGSGVTIALEIAALPVIEGSEPLAVSRYFTRAYKTNRAYLADRLVVSPGVNPERADYAFDPQTSGGLLVSIAPERVDLFVSELKSRGAQAAAIVGRVVSRQGPVAVVLR